jgi:hypothetical protein
MFSTATSSAFRPISRSPVFGQQSSSDKKSAQTSVTSDEPAVGKPPSRTKERIFQGTAIAGMLLGTASIFASVSTEQMMTQPTADKEITRQLGQEAKNISTEPQQRTNPFKVSPDALPPGVLQQLNDAAAQHKKDLKQADAALNKILEAQHDPLIAANFLKYAKAIESHTGDEGRHLADMVSTSFPDLTKQERTKLVKLADSLKQDPGLKNQHKAVNVLLDDILKPHIKQPDVLAETRTELNQWFERLEKAPDKEKRLETIDYTLLGTTLSTWSLGCAFAIASTRATRARTRQERVLSQADS